MSLEFTPERKNEAIADAYYRELQQSEALVTATLNEIESVLVSHDRETAEKIISGELGDKMSAALEQSKQALKKWLEALK